MKKLMFSLLNNFRGKGLTKNPYLLPFILLVTKYFSLFNPRKVEVDGMTFYLDKHDSLGLSYNTFEPEIVEVFKKYITKDSVVVDIGANIGYHTVVASKLAKRVIAFEPEMNNFKLLRKNIEANNCDNVLLISSGISNFTGKADLYVSKENCGWHSSIIQVGKPTSTMFITLDEFLHGLKVDFIKMDIEGAEGLALQGMVKTLEKWHPIVISEFKKDQIEKTGVSADEFFKTFEKLGYTKTEIGTPIGDSESTTHNYLFK